MSVLPASADFTDKDFESLRLRLQALIRSVFPTWSDFQVTNFGNILTDMMAFVGDVLTFTQDNQALESRIVTATQRRNLISLAKLVNYTPALASAATADETFTATGLAFNAVIPAGTIIKTATDGISFQLLSAVTLTPSVPSAVGTVENSTTQTQAYLGTGQPNQTLTLPLNPFLEIVSLSYDAGPVLFTKVDNFLFSSSTDKVFTIQVDNNDVCTVSFGDGVQGVMPSGAITALYKTGGGSVGNVAASSITEIDTILDTHGNLVNLTITNLSAAGGGEDRESNASIRLRAPLSITAPSSSIARTDFEVNALRITGVERALMLTANEDAIPNNSGILYIVPSGNPPGAPSGTLIEKVRLQFEGDTQARAPFPKPLTFNLSVLAPSYVDFTISVGVYLKRNAVPATVAATIRAGFANFFSPTVTDAIQAATLGVEIGARNPSIDFGYYLRLQNSAPVTSPQFGKGYIEMSDLMDVVHDAAGVRGIGTLDSQFLVNGNHADVALAPKEFPRIAALPGSVTITDLDTGASL